MVVYNGVKLYGGQTNIYTLAEKDVTKTVLDQEEQTVTNPFVDLVITPTWNLTTILMTKYTADPLNLSASNISTGNSNIVGYRIMREQQGKLQKVTDITTNEKIVYDFSCPNNVS